MDFDVDVRKLSPKFYRAYPSTTYPEILWKPDRPYSCLLVDTHEGYFICVPFRSDMVHNNGYHFSGTGRSGRSKSGLDYKKMILVEDPSYIDDGAAVVDSDEYKAVISNLPQIVNEVVNYIETYKNHISGEDVLHSREFDRCYRFSTLPYFHDVLGLT